MSSDVKLEGLLTRFGLVLTDDPDFDHDEQTFEKAKASFVAALTTPAPSSEREAVLEIVADVLDCFWNAAIGSARETQDSTAIAISGSLAEGFAAMATRLRETALTTPAPAAHPEREAVLDEALTKISDMGDDEIYANPAAVKRLVRDALSAPAPEGSAAGIAEKARSFAKSKTKLLREVVESRRTTPAPAVSRDEIVDLDSCALLAGMLDPSTRVFTKDQLRAILSSLEAAPAVLKDEIVAALEGLLVYAPEPLDTLDRSGRAVAWRNARTILSRLKGEE